MWHAHITFFVHSGLDMSSDVVGERDGLRKYQLFGVSVSCSLLLYLQAPLLIVQEPIYINHDKYKTYVNDTSLL